MRIQTSMGGSLHPRTACAACSQEKNSVYDKFVKNKQCQAAVSHKAALTRRAPLKWLSRHPHPPCSPDPSRETSNGLFRRMSVEKTSRSRLKCTSRASIDAHVASEARMHRNRLGKLHAFHQKPPFRGNLVRAAAWKPTNPKRLGLGQQLRTTCY